MKLSSAAIKSLCAGSGLSLRDLLDRAGVSRTAYYSLVRRPSILPGSVRSIAATLDVSPAQLLEDTDPLLDRACRLQRQARAVVRRHPGVSFENVWHTLVLLEKEPLDRLKRSLLRGRAVNLH